MKHLFWVVIVVSLISSRLSAATPEWSYKLGEAVKWQQVTSVGTLLVGTDKALYSLDPEKGELLWSREDLKKTAPFNVREIEGTPYLLVNDYQGPMSTKSKLYGVNLLSGENVWQTDELQGMSIGAFPVARKNVAVLFVNTHTKEDGSGIYLKAFDLTSGKQLWQTRYAKQNDVPLHPADNSGTWFVKMDLSGHSEPVAEGDFLYLPFAGVHCVDLNTGTIKWGVEFKSVSKDFKRACAPLLIDGDTIYGAGLGEVYAIDKASGTVKWKSKKVRSGTITQTLAAGDKVFVRLGGNFLRWGAKQWELEKPLQVLALEKASGTQLWEYANAKDGITNMKYLPENNTVMLADARTLIGIDAASSGKVKETFKLPLEFKRKLGGGEIAGSALKVGFGGIGGLVGGIGKLAGDKDRLDIPVAITTQQGGSLVIRGKQHLLAFDPAKQEVRWSTQYAAPGASGWEMAIMTTLTAFTATGYSAGAASGQMSLDTANSGLRSSFARYDKVVEKRYSATKAADQFVYVLTTVEEGKSKGAGLVAIDMNTGEATTQILLKDKEPDYIVDDIEGRLFYVKDNKEIQAFKMR